MRINSAALIRWSGLAAMVAGIYYAGIQPIHPPDALASVNTAAWAIITPLKVAMCFLFLLGLAGLYVKQVEKVGWLGLVGWLLFSVSWALNLAFIFAEAFIMPLLATTTPTFVEGFFGIVNGHPVDVNLGALPALYSLTGILYLLGGLLFGIGTFRAGILPRWPAGLLAITAALTPAAAFLPHYLQRFAAIPMGLALAWLGCALLSERREHVAAPVAVEGNPRLRHIGAE